MILLSLVFCLACPAHGQQSMTLSECIRAAIDRNLDVKGQDLRVSKGTLAITQARARLLPQIGVTAAFNDNVADPVTVTGGTLLGKDFPDDMTWQKIRSTQYQSSSAIEAALPLIDLTRRAAIDVAKETATLAKVGREQAIETLTVQLARVYYLAQTTKEQQRLTDENIHRMSELCDIAEALYQKGVALEIDASRVHIHLKNLQVVRQRYQTLFAQQLNMLRYLMNVDEATALDVVPVQTAVQGVGSLAVDTLLPELRLNAQQQTVLARQQRRVRMGYLPKLSVVGSAGYTMFAEKFNHSHWFGNAIVGLRLTVPLFDANEKKHALRQLRLDSDNLRIAREQTLNRLRRECDDDRLQMEQNRTAYLTQKDNYRLAQEVYAVTREKYKEGVASMTEVLQDEMSLRNAYTACLDALYQYKCARLALLRLTGHLDELNDE